MDEHDRREQGMRTRRLVLGDDHVDRAVAATTPFTAKFQDLITRYAWGEIWADDTLDRRMRSRVTICLLAVLGHHEELAMHIRAARRGGVTDAEISQVLQQTATYAGPEVAAAAERVAHQVFDTDG